MKLLNRGFRLNLYLKLIGLLMKKGNKKKAKAIVDNTFLKISKITKQSVLTLLYKIFSKLNIFVEAKVVRIKRRTHIVPFSINLKRRSYLIVKWLVKSIKENNKKIPITDKVVEEVINIFKGQSKTSKLRDTNNALALSNRSNMHYRW